MHPMSTFKKQLIILILIFLTNTLSFALGYLMANDGQRSPIVIEKAKS
jgi:hypothetical protein